MSGLDIHDLSAGYGGRPIVQGLSLPPLRPGEVVSVVGPNGAGKSTFLRALAGLIPAKGAIRLDGAELTGLSLADRAKRVTYMPQTLPQGVALSVLETVVASIRATPLGGASFTDQQAVERAYEVLQRIGAEALAGQRLDRLSGGQKQLAGLAQALAREPRLLLRSGGRAGHDGDDRPARPAGGGAGVRPDRRHGQGAAGRLRDAGRSRHARYPGRGLSRLCPGPALRSRRAAGDDRRRADELTIGQRRPTKRPGCICGRAFLIGSDHDQGRISVTTSPVGSTGTGVPAGAPRGRPRALFET